MRARAHADRRAEPLHRDGRAGDRPQPTAYPQDLRGDLLFTEPVGRLIRRAQDRQDRRADAAAQRLPGRRSSSSSTDPLFRPVNIKHGPDGTIYIADMYHGIIQEAQWTPRGSYLRAQDPAVPARQGHQPRPHLAAAVRRHAGGDPGRSAAPPGAAGRRRRSRSTDAAAHAERDAGAARRAPRASERLVARHGAAAARAEAGQVGRAGAAASSRGTASNLVGRFHALWTLEGLRRARRGARARADEGREPAHAGSGDSRERDALQGRRQVVRRRLPRGDEGRRRRRRASRRC